MRFLLTAAENHDTGEIGWRHPRMGNSEAYGPTSGALTLAHDMLEHFAFESVADEIMAHGAMYWIRYEGGWSSEYGNSLSLEGFAGEWTSLFHGLSYDSYLPLPPRTRALDSSVEEDISSIMEGGRKDIIRNGYADENARATIREIEKVFRAYFRMGYRKAQRRYKGLAACEVAHLFSVLESKLEHWKPECEGQQITVTIHPRTGEVTVKEMETTEY